MNLCSWLDKKLYTTSRSFVAHSQESTAGFFPDAGDSNADHPTLRT
jgi:hypothetical protein